MQRRSVKCRLALTPKIPKCPEQLICVTHSRFDGKASGHQGHKESESLPKSTILDTRLYALLTAELVGALLLDLALASSLATEG